MTIYFESECEVDFDFDYEKVAKDVINTAIEHMNFPFETIILKKLYPSLLRLRDANSCEFEYSM